MRFAPGPAAPGHWFPRSPPLTAETRLRRRLSRPPGSARFAGLSPERALSPTMGVMPELHILRVFTAEDGSGGNLLGVFLDGTDVPHAKRQPVATQLGFSE